MPSYLTGGCLLDDGRVFCAPGQYTIRHLGIYNPSDNSFLKQPYKNYNDTYPFIAAITLSDGNVLLVPNYFNKVVVYNPLTNMIVQMATTSTTNSQYRGAILHTNGKVYLTPKASKNIGIYDLTTNTFSLSTAVCASNSDFCGGVLLANGKICLVPYNSDYVKIYDPATDSVATGAYVSTTNGMFDNGLMMGNGKVCFIPTNAYKKIGIYDPVADTYTDGPVTPHGYFSGGVVLDDGRIFLSSNNANATGLYDPSTNTYESGCLLDSTETGGCVKLTDGNVMIIPYGGENVLIYDPVTNSYEHGPVSTTNVTDFTDIAGSGTVDDPFLIRHIHDLFLLETYINACYFKQTTNIELGLYGRWPGLCDYYDAFQGYYDADNHTLNNMEIYYANSNQRGGLFGAIGANAEIKNLTLVDVVGNFSTSDSTHGVFTSDAWGALFDNCHVNSTINQTDSSWSVNGFVGYATWCKFHNCSATTIINQSCTTSENTGFVCQAYECEFNFCHANVTMNQLSGSGLYAGGAGFAYWIYGNTRMEQCSAIGSITGDVGFQEAAGFIDWISINTSLTGGEILIKDCFANVDLILLNPVNDLGDSGSFINVLSIYSGAWDVTIENCYSSGNFVYGENGAPSDAFISLDVSLGRASTFTYQNNFYDAEKNTNTSIYATGLTTVNMKIQESFTNWDFDDVWLVDGDYPEFIGYGAWEIPADPILPITTKRHLGGNYANVATEIGKLSIAPVDIFYSSDGFIYVATTTKIYKTNLDFTELIEMVLVGNIDTTFHRFAEAKDGIIIIGDDSMFWTKSKNYNQFGQSEYIGYQNSNGANAGNPDDYNICSLADTKYSSSNWIFDIRNGKEPSGYFSIDAKFDGVPVQSPLYVNSTIGYLIIQMSYKYTDKYGTVVGTDSFDSFRFTWGDDLNTQILQQPLLLKHSNGDFYGIYRGNVGDELLVTKSMTLNSMDILLCDVYNTGLTFEEVGLFRGFFELINNEFLILHNNKIYITDFYTHLTKTQELDGTDIICTCKVDGYGVIIITNGSTNNAYLLPYENSRITQPIGASTSNAAAIDHANSVFEDIRNSIETQGIDTEDLPIEHFPMLIREIV